MPSSGPEDYPPSVGPDEYAIINPDFWGEGIDSPKFKGWSNLSKVRVCGLLLFCFPMIVCVVG